ncbi:MAG: hypothetical protein IGS03_08575 [Candidatus Sericytochromatia bacterium]|nr:hypothetical protein [Candidatus Sericytochromatia bacterium]
MLSGDMSVPRPDLASLQPTAAVSPPPPEVQSEPLQEASPVEQPDAGAADLAPDANRVTLRSEFSAFDPVQSDGVFNLNLLQSRALTPDLLYDDSEIRLSPRLSPDLLGRSAFGSNNGFGLNLNAFDFSPAALRFSAPAEPASEIPQAPAPESDSGATAAVPEPLASLPEAEGLSSSRTVLRGEQLEARIGEMQGQITSGLERLSQLPEGEARNAAQERLTELQTLINENAASPELVAQLQQHLLSQDTTSESEASFHERLTAPHTDNGEPLSEPADNLYGRRTDAALREYIERLANTASEAPAPVVPEPQPEAAVENPPVEVSEEPIAEMPDPAEPVDEAPVSEPEPETEVAEPAEDAPEAEPESGSPLASLTVQEVGDAQDIPARLAAIDQAIESLGGRPLLRKFAENDDLIMAASRVRSGLTQAENEPLLQQADAVSDFQDWIHFNEGFFEQNPEHREALQGLMTERIQLMLSQQREQISGEDGASLAQISFEPFSYQAFLQPATYIEWGPVDLFNADVTMMA